MLRVITVLLLSLFCPVALAKTANPQGTNAAREVLALFVQLQNNDQILLGQDLGHGNSIVTGYDEYVTTLHSQTGKWVGFIGGDYGLDSNHNVASTNQVLIDHSNAGGVVTVSWHFNNPWTGGASWDTTKKENLWELLDPAQAAYSVWQAQKVQIANALRPLRDAGVPILWRPLHEMNGDWFWWGQKNRDRHENAYIAVWKDMFNYLTYEQGMNNLLWVYSVASSQDQLLTNYYPGSEYVDIVGIDVYSDPVDTWFTDRDYQDMKSFGKPMGLTEFGPTLSSADGDYDYRRLINAMISKWPDFSFSYSWHNWFDNGSEVKISYSSNQAISSVFTRSNTITLDEINLGTNVQPTNPSPTNPPPTNPPPTNPPPTNPPPTNPPPTNAPRTNPPTNPPTKPPTNPPQPTGITPDQTVELRIKNRYTNKYLTLSDNNIGAPVQLWDLNSVWYSQRWLMAPAQEEFPGQVRFRCKWDETWYLSNPKDENNVEAVGWEYEQWWWSLRWELETIDEGVFRIKNLWNGRYLSAGGSTDENVVIYDGNPSWWSQHWVFEPIVAG